MQRNFEMIMFYNYVLQSEKDESLYKGRTENLRVRLEQHNQSKVKSTRAKAPWRLIYYEACLKRSDAIRRERYLKTSQGSRLLKRRLKDYFYEQKDE